MSSVRIWMIGLMASMVACGVADATPIAVGSGSHQADLVVEFADGGVHDFLVFFDNTATGIGLFDIVEAHTSLTTVRGDFGFGIFIDGISYDGHSNVGYAGGENWWHYWTREAGGAWTSSFIGAADRVVNDGSADGWVYGHASAPAPEPATAALVTVAGVLILRRRGRG